MLLITYLLQCCKNRVDVLDPSLKLLSRFNNDVQIHHFCPPIIKFSKNVIEDYKLIGIITPWSKKNRSLALYRFKWITYRLLLARQELIQHNSVRAPILIHRQHKIRTNVKTIISGYLCQHKPSLFTATREFLTQS